MRKLTGTLLASLLFIAACQKNTESTVADEAQTDEPVVQITKRNCAADDVLQAQLAANPALANRMAAIESFTQKAIASGEVSRLVNGVIEIPVVVHVLYRTSAENISDAQIASQIKVLNDDFNKLNADASKVPDEFKDEQTSIAVKFVFSQTIRKKTNKRSWGTNDAMKKSSQGGSDPVSPTTTLNMWACNLGQGLLGYAQFPGGNPATDGVVILYSAFGNTGTLIQTYNKGRTATHEVGHWMNLRHIWGDATCGNDGVGDTPPHYTANYGCPSYPLKSRCNAAYNEMTMNYMDYTDDACMYMFSNGQRDRALATFAVGGPRASFR